MSRVAFRIQQVCNLKVTLGCCCGCQGDQSLEISGIARAHAIRCFEMKSQRCRIDLGVLAQQPERVKIDPARQTLERHWLW